MALSVLLIPPPKASSQPSSTESTPSTHVQEPASLAGGYTLAEPRSRVAARIERAIETATEDMSFVIRGFARGRINEQNPTIRNLRIAISEDEVAVSFDGRTLRADRAGGRTPVTLQSGDEAQLSFRLGEDGLVQTFELEEGTRRNVFSLRPDGMLVMRVMLEAGRLPAPVRYQVTYRRSRD